MDALLLSHQVWRQKGDWNQHHEHQDSRGCFSHHHHQLQAPSTCHRVWPTSITTSPPRVRFYHHLCSPGHTGRRTSQCAWVPQIHFLFFFLRLRGETNGRKTSCWSLSRVWNCLMHQFPHLKTEMTMVPSVLRFNEVKYVNQSLNQSLVQKWIGVIINNNYNIIILLLSCNNNNIMSDTRTWWCGIKTKAHLWCYQMSWWKKTKKVIKKKKRKKTKKVINTCVTTPHTQMYTQFLNSALNSRFSQLCLLPEASLCSPLIPIPSHPHCHLSAHRPQCPLSRSWDISGHFSSTCWNGKYQGQG